MTRMLTLAAIVVSLLSARAHGQAAEAGDWVAPHEGWSDEQLRCLNYMEEADTSYDHLLNHHEYFTFAERMANNMFGMVQGLDQENDWFLEELYEKLIVMNPRREVSGLDIFGSGYGLLDTIGEEQEQYLKQICLETKHAIIAMAPGGKL